MREKLGNEYKSVNHKFSVNGFDGYLTVGTNDQNKPLVLFIKMSKQGSTLGGLLDSFARMTSLALQYGVPLEVLVTKFKGTRFEPLGYTSNKKLPRADSIVDYIFQWLEAKYVGKEKEEGVE